MGTSKKRAITPAEQISSTQYLIEAICAYMRKNGITQSALGKRLNLSQGTISKMLNYTESQNSFLLLSFSEALKICAVMGTSIGTVLYEYDQSQNAQYSSEYSWESGEEYLKASAEKNIPEESRLFYGCGSGLFPYYLFPQDALLTNNIEDSMFQPWFGKYHCYFHSTLSRENVLFHGQLEIPDKSESGYCHVHFSFVYDISRHLQKEYYGQLTLSKRSTNGAYFTLVNHEDQGEITYLVMSNPSIKNSQVSCVVAFVATISAGKGTQHPCVERMIISRKPLSESELEIAKAHLLLNDKYIRISEDEFCAMLKSQSTPLKFREKFNRFCNPFDDPILSEYSTKIAIIPESWIKSLPGYTEEEQRTIIDLMRLHSLAPKYNKINQKASENDIYELNKDSY